MSIPPQNLLQPESSVPIEAPAAAALPEPTERMRTSGLGLWLRDLVISATVSVLIILFLYQPVRVEGTSMLPRLEDHDRLFINKFVYHITSIERGDVVVFHYPRDPEKSYIKRVIALPGDRLRIDHGQVWVNGKALAEIYVPEEGDVRPEQQHDGKEAEVVAVAERLTRTGAADEFGVRPGA